MGKITLRKDKKKRVLKRGESIRADGKYQYKYFVNGKAKFLYSWKLEPTDRLPAGKRPCLSLRELEKQLGFYEERNVAAFGSGITVLELVERYVATKTGVRHSTKAGCKNVINTLTSVENTSRIVGLILAGASLIVYTISESVLDADSILVNGTTDVAPEKEEG